MLILSSLLALIPSVELNILIGKAMELPQKFYDSLPKKTASELAQMWASLEEFSDEAREAAKHELMRRGITPATLSQIKGDAENQERHDSVRRNEPLPWGERLVCILVPGVAVFYARQFAAAGYRRKASEAASYFALHLVFVVAFKWGLIRW